ncbi:hypothetical protein [Micromonospora sp. NPDC049891]|uniref:hypothetical protein n=1 Tax=Micromonospora sp. NPDC049891 TaxID=3155655 RepID=UPI0033EECF46
MSHSTRLADTVTVTRHGNRYKVTFSRFPGHTFGPWDLTETIRDLTISAGLTRVDARNLALDAAANGSATAPVAQ